MVVGILKRWNPLQHWGIIYSPGSMRYFFHDSKLIEGTPALFARVEFDVAPARNPGELSQAINVKCGAVVIAAQYGDKEAL